MSIGGRPLAGRQLLLLVPEDRVDDWSAALKTSGATIAATPLTRTEALTDAEYRELDDWLSADDPDDFLVVTSAAGVRHLVARGSAVGVDMLRRLTPPLQVIAIGPATAQALSVAGRPADRMATESRAEGVLALLAGTPGGLAGRRVVLLRAVEGRSELPDGLLGAGADFRLLPVYRTVIIPGAAERLAERLRSSGDRPEAIIVTSGRPLAALAAVLESEHRMSVPLVALGPVTAEAARGLGFRVAAVAEEPTPSALESAIVRVFSSR